jgi:predicted GIY-YIG superfamily endonuclease
MPDYAKTQIYKIVSKDSNINNFYIGSTTNWTKRKQTHKMNCNNEKKRHYNLQIYQIIRANGGFENFNMILVEDYPCENRRQAEQREQYWKDLLKPDMNMINPFMNPLKKDDPNFHKEHYKIYNVRQKEHKKLYSIKNKDKKAEYDREYRLKNNNYRKNQKKSYYIWSNIKKEFLNILLN